MVALPVASLITDLRTVWRMTLKLAKKNLRRPECSEGGQTGVYAGEQLDRFADLAVCASCVLRMFTANLIMSRVCPKICVN